MASARVPGGDSLLSYQLKLSDHLAYLQTGSLREHAEQILQQVALRTGAVHSHLLIIRGREALDRSIRLFAEWSGESVPRISPSMPTANLAFLGARAVETLNEGVIVFTRITEEQEACSKLVSGMIRELQVTCLEMIPVRIHKRLRAILCLAHSNSEPLMDSYKGPLVQLIGKTTVLALQRIRKQRRRDREHRQWKRVANGACDFAIRVNPHYEITAVVPFRQHRVPAVRGLPLQEFVSPRSWGTLSETVSESLRSHTPRMTEIRAIDVHSRVCSYAIRIEPSSGRSRELMTIYLTNNDVENAHAEQLRELHAQLDRASRLSLLGHLATEFAHQLTQPLTAISAKCFTLRSRLLRGEPADACLELAHSVDQHVNHARDIINSLRDFVRDRRMNATAVCLREMIDYAVRMIALPSERETVRISVSDPKGILVQPDPVCVYVDRVHTTHVLLNLMVNAMEACANAAVNVTEIMIQAMPDEGGQKIVIEVSDNGPGLPPDRLNSVFDRFFTTKSEGFGIGLAICRDVIERQGGSIHARNNRNSGCCFHFTLPVYCGQDLDDEEPDDESAETENE